MRNIEIMFSRDCIVSRRAYFDLKNVDLGDMKVKLKSTSFFKMAT